MKTETGQQVTVKTIFKLGWLFPVCLLLAALFFLSGASRYTSRHVSHIENLMFELFKYAQATTIKGAQHFGPDYAHWHGMADLWNKYIAIKEEAERLYLEAGIKKKFEIESKEYPMFKYEKETGHELDSLS